MRPSDGISQGYAVRDLEAAAIHRDSRVMVGVVVGARGG
jgi:hypothetical protein